MEDWEVEKNTHIDVVEETKGNYLWSFEYAEAQVNLLDEVSQSYLHQGNLKLDQTRHIVETWDHESADSEVVKILSMIYAFYEEKKHVIMDCPFMPFHIRASIAKHVEL
jgi:hypothetical protein